jgi:hypothetical protein
MVLDRKAVVLSRLWCLYECSIALRRYGATKFRIAAHGFSVPETESLFTLFEVIDISGTETSSERDKVEVLSKVGRRSKSSKV